MANLNKVFLIGNLTRDPELRYVPSGTAVVTFTLAVNRVYTSQAGEKKEEASFIRVVVWGRRAEVCGEYLSKGKSVFVEGRIQSRSWETPEGQKRSSIEVIADNVQFLRLGAKEAKEPSQRQDAPAPAEGMETIDLNNEAASPSSGKAAGAPAEGNLSDKEAPF